MKSITEKLHPETIWDLLHQMIRIRRFEEKAAELYSAGKIRGFLHLYIGEEAVATGAVRALSPEDAIVATYREHGHALVRGISARSIMAEMYGKVEGCSRGRGGSMHLFDAKSRFYGGNAIVAGGLPVAVGLALADRMQGRDRVTVCFFGEGAMAEGDFHESVNLAALWKLPVLFACENNLYAMGTALERSESQVDLCVKACSFNIEVESVNGMDVVAVATVMERIVKEIRQTKEPRFVEFKTYRFRAHSMFDPDLYRSKEEVHEWEKKDPIPLLLSRMKEADILEEDRLHRIEANVAGEIADAVAFAEAGTWERVEDLGKDVYTPIAGGTT